MEKDDIYAKDIDEGDNGLVSYKVTSVTCEGGTDRCVPDANGFFDIIDTSSTSTDVHGRFVSRKNFKGFYGNYKITVEVS